MCTKLPNSSHSNNLDEISNQTKFDNLRTKVTNLKR